MKFRPGIVARWLAIALFTIGLVFAGPGRGHFGSTFPEAGSAGIFFHDISDEDHKKGLSRDQLAKEAWVWHRANQLRMEKLYGPQALTADIVITDTDDISVIQGDSRLITPTNLFDLTGFKVQFTPSIAAGYTVTASGGAFDTNLGTKLNLTAPPAVNPKAQADPGDDAYLLQDIGFNFTFFGSSYSSVAISSNGFLTFRPGNVGQATFDNDSVDSGESLSSFQAGVPRIAPYWHDLTAEAAQTTGSNGIYLRKDNDRIVVTWNNIRDYPNDPVVDRGLHRFQVTLFNDGRIVFTYSLVQLTSNALVGISPGGTQATPVLLDLSAGSANPSTSPQAEFFSTSTMVDYLAAIQAFYIAHPNQDVYDFVYFLTDFNFSLGGDAFAFYLPIRNEASGIGLTIFDNDPSATLGSQKINGILNLANISNSYPSSPVTRFLGANHALSVMGQEQGHRWLSFPRYPGNNLLLLGRDDAHWSFFMNIESTISSPAARRSSSMEGNVWQNNGNGTFTSVNLIDGYSRLDQYLMGLRPSTDVPDTFVITNPTNTVFTRGSSPRPNTNVTGTSQTVTINQILQANGQRVPNVSQSQKSFRAAVILLVRQGTQPSAQTLNKVNLYRLTWESYFSQSTDFLSTINTGLAPSGVSRVIAAASAASFKSTLAPGEIASLFGSGLTGGETLAATSQPLPTTMAGVQVLIDGTPAPLYFVSPNQINFQVPRSILATTSNPAVSSSTALVEVIRNGVRTRACTFQIAPAVPAIFTLNQSGTGAAAALDGITGAPGPFNAKQTNGQPNILAVFGTGLGADVTDVNGNVSASVQATIDGANATVTYAGRAPGFTGLNQWNVTLPANVTAGVRKLIISRNGIPSREVTIEIK